MGDCRLANGEILFADCRLRGDTAVTLRVD
jgi:hypothetical protein